MENIDQARSRKDALIADMSEALWKDSGTSPLPDRCAERNRCGRLRGENVVLRTIPVHSRFAQSRAGGNHRLIAERDSLDLVERNQIFGVERGDAPGGGFEIVDENRLLDVEFVGQALGLDDPGKIGGFHPAVAHRAGHAEAGRVGMHI